MFINIILLKGRPPSPSHLSRTQKNKGGRKHCPRINGRFVYNIRATETRGKKSLLARRKFPRKTRSDHKKFAADSLSSSRRRVWGVSVPAVGGFAVHADSGAARCPLRAAVLFSTLEGGGQARRCAPKTGPAPKKIRFAVAADVWTKPVSPDYAGAYARTSNIEAVGEPFVARHFMSTFLMPAGSKSKTSLFW